MSGRRGRERGSTPDHRLSRPVRRREGDSRPELHGCPHAILSPFHSNPSVHVNPESRAVAIRSPRTPGPPTRGRGGRPCPGRVRVTSSSPLFLRPIVPTVLPTTHPSFPSWREHDTLEGPSRYVVPPLPGRLSPEGTSHCPLPRLSLDPREGLRPVSRSPDWGFGLRSRRGNREDLDPPPTPPCLRRTVALVGGGVETSHEPGETGGTRDGRLYSRGGTRARPVEARPDPHRLERKRPALGSGASGASASQEFDVEGRDPQGRKLKGPLQGRRQATWRVSSPPVPSIVSAPAGNPHSPDCPRRSIGTHPTFQSHPRSHPPLSPPRGR